MDAVANQQPLDEENEEAEHAPEAAPDNATPASVLFQLDGDITYSPLQQT